MGKVVALLAAALPLLAWPQEAPPPPAAPGQARQELAPPPAPPQADQPAPQAAPPPSVQTPPPPAVQAPPAVQTAPPPAEQTPPAPGEPPPPQAPPAQVAPSGPPAPVPPPARRRERGPWYVGFGIGAGNGTVTRSVGTRSLRSYAREEVRGTPGSLSLEFEIGATLSPRLLVGFDTTRVVAAAKGDSAYGADTTVSVWIEDYDAVATFFPWERGLFVRGGVGLSAFVRQVRTPSGTGSNTYAGMNAIAGVGYAFWLLRSFNLTVDLDLSAQSYGSSNDLGAPSSSAFWALRVGCDWY